MRRWERETVTYHVENGFLCAPCAGGLLLAAPRCHSRERPAGAA